MDINQLKINPKNPRIIKKDEFERLKKKIREFPEMLEKRPIVYDENNIVLGGNQRLRVLQELVKEGFEIKDEYFKSAESWTEEQKRKFVILDNISDGSWDNEMLGNEWSDLPLDEWGLVGKWSKEVVEDEAPEVSDEPAISKLGEVYQLGRHRLMCGDSTRIKDVEKLMNGQKADMVFTDPPYGIGYEYNKHDDKSNESNAQLVADAFALFECGKVWTCGLHNLARDISRFGKTKVAVWYKKFAQAGSGLGGASTWEPVLILNPIATNLDNDVLEVMTDRERGLREEHSCPKPIKLFAELLKAFSNKDNIIVDMFGGSGSTLIAAEQTNRTCYMMELDAKYCDVIRKRYAKFIGKEEEWQKITPVL